MPNPAREADYFKGPITLPERNPSESVFDRPKRPFLRLALILLLIPAVALGLYLKPDLVGRVLGVIDQGGSAVTLDLVLDESFNLDLAGYIRGSQLRSTAASGAPLTVASTGLVTSLNADLLDGQHGSYYLNLGNQTGTCTNCLTGTEISESTLSGIDAALLEGQAGSYYLAWANFTGKPVVLSSLDGVSNNGGDIDLIAGANVTITPDNTADTITIAATSSPPSWSSLTDPTANLTLNHGTNTTTFNSSITGGTFLTIDAPSMTNGKIFRITGTYDHFTSSEAASIVISTAPSEFCCQSTTAFSVTNDDPSAFENDIWAIKGIVNNSSNTSTGTHTIRGGQFSASGKTAGTTTAIGIQASASGADNNYAAIFGNGKVGIGTTTPATQLDILTSSTAQLRLSYSGSSFTQLNTNSSGNLVISPSGSFVEVDATGGLYISYPAADFTVRTAAPDANAAATICFDDTCTKPTSSSTAMVLSSHDNSTSGSSIRARGTVTGGLSDVGEYIKFEGSRFQYTQGDVLVSSALLDEAVAKSTSGYQNNILGVVTTTAGIVAGGGDETITYDSSGNPINRVIIALAGRVPVKVTDENGSIQRGDFLTSSATRTGYAMRATQAGRVLGVALEPLSSGEGTVMTFINPTWWDPGTAVGEDGGVGIPDHLNVLSVGAEEGIFESLVSTVSAIFESLTARVAEIATAVIGELTAGRLTVGESESPSGITIYDRANGDPYCVFIEEGEILRDPGACE